MDVDLLRQYLEFYQDLGITTLYRRPSEPGSQAVIVENNVGQDAILRADCQSAPVRAEAGGTAQCHSFFHLRRGPHGEALVYVCFDVALRLGNLRRCPQISRGLERRLLRSGSLQQATR